MQHFNRHHYTMLTLLGAVWIWAAIAPLHRDDWLLENLLVFVTFLVLGGTYRRFQFSLLSYWLITLFLCLHLYGSHYTYAETPFGFWLMDMLELKRNHYDRIVHFSFGLLTVIPFLELIARKTPLRGEWLYGYGLCVILGWSAFYETIEMLATLVVNPELGSAFLGTQGDEWDAQKDTGLAFLGSLVTVALLAVGTLKPTWPPSNRAT